MSGTFVQGNAFLTGESGVGAYVPDQPKYKSFQDSFLDSYNTVRRWKMADEAQKNLKRAQLKQDTAAIDFDTKGLRPLAQKSFQEKKYKIIDEHTKAFTESGGDLNKPEYIDKQRYLEELTGVYKTQVEGEVAVYDLMKTAMTEYDKDPDAFPDDFRDKLAAVWNAPVDPNPNNPDQKTAGQLVQGLLMQKKGKTINDAMGEWKTKQGEDVTETKDPTTGMTIKRSSFGTDEDVLAAYNDQNTDVSRTMRKGFMELFEQANIELPDKSSPDYPVRKSFKDSAMQQAESVKQFMDDWNNDKKTKDNPITLDQAYTLTAAKPYYSRKSEITVDPETEYWKAFFKDKGMGDQAATELSDTFWTWTQLMGGVGSVYTNSTDESGNTVLRANTLINAPIGEFKTKVGGTDGGGVTIDNKLLGITTFKDIEGKQVWQYRTTETEDVQNDPKRGIKDGVLTTKDPKELLNVFSSAWDTKQGGQGGTKYKPNKGEVQKMFYDFVKKNKIFDDSNKEILVDKIPSLFKNQVQQPYTSIIVEQQKQLGVLAGAPGQQNISGAIDAGKFPLTPPQKEIYDAYVKKNGKPSDSEIKTLFKKDWGEESDDFPDAPKVGDIEGGYKFLGGDPTSPENWEKQ